MTELQTINKQIKELNARKLELLAERETKNSKDGILFTMLMPHGLKQEVETIVGQKKVASIIRQLLTQFVEENG